MTIKNAFCTITTTTFKSCVLGEYVRFLHTVVKLAKTLSLNFYFEVKISVSTCARGTNVTLRAWYPNIQCYLFGINIPIKMCSAKCHSQISPKAYVSRE